MFRRIILAVILTASCLAQDKVPNASIARMEQIVQAYVPGKFMGTVLVAQDGKILVDKAYGFANLEWEVPNTPTTKFRLGSITKQFTAASILLLEERGKLKVEDPVKKYMPDAPAAWDKITIFHVLTHTSGIPSLTSFPDFETHEAQAMTPEKLVEWFRDKPLEFEPATKWNYSNSGYILLGYLIEKISGQSYSDFVQQNIFTPLGMKDSGYDSNSTLITHRASGYLKGPVAIVNAPYIHMSVPHAAGAVVSQASLTKMTTPFKNDYAFGLTSREEKGRRVIWHNGGIDGFNTSMA